MSLRQHFRQKFQVRRRLIKHWQQGTLMYALGLVCMAPILFEPKLPMESLVQDTLFIIDISESMNVRDVRFPQPNSDRLTLAKQAVTASIASLPCGSNVSVALFAGDEAIVLFEPLEVCGHFPAIEQVVMRLDTRMRWIGDSWVLRALMMGIREAEKRKMSLVMITDADEMPYKSAPRLNDLLEVKGKVNGLLLGVGNETPQPVPKLDGQQRITAYWTPEEAVLEGNHPNLLAYVKELQLGERAPAGALDEVTEHLSAFNRPLLQSAAQAAHLQFAHIQQPTDAVTALRSLPLKASAHAERDASWICALAAALCVLAGWFWHRLPNRFTRNHHQMISMQTPHIGNKSHIK